MNSLPCKIKLPAIYQRTIFDRFTRYLPNKTEAFPKQTSLFQMKSNEHVFQLKIERVFICHNSDWFKFCCSNFQLNLQNYNVVNQSKRSCLFVLTLNEWSISLVDCNHMMNFGFRVSLYVIIKQWTMRPLRSTAMIDNITYVHRTCIQYCMQYAYYNFIEMQPTGRK